MSSCLYDFVVDDSSGNPYPLRRLEGRVVIIANIASLCTFSAANMTSLRDLHSRHNSRGNGGDVDVLAFPCSQFANQETRSACEVRQWAADQFGASFDIMQRVDVKGPKAHPLFVFLQANAGTIRWNYTKFVCDRNGKVRRRFGPGEAGLDEFVEGLLRE